MRGDTTIVRANLPIFAIAKLEDMAKNQNKTINEVAIKILKEKLDEDKIV